jgi:hypothetical protein
MTPWSGAQHAARHLLLWYHGYVLLRDTWIGLLIMQCTYTVLGPVIFEVNDDFERHKMQGAVPGLVNLQRQVCYFGDEECMGGFFSKYMGTTT